MSELTLNTQKELKLTQGQIANMIEDLIGEKQRLRETIIEHDIAMCEGKDHSWKSVTDISASVKEMKQEIIDMVNSI